MSLSPSGADTRGRNRVCKQCKFSSTDAKEFYKHQVTAHGSEEDSYSCEQCGDKLDSESALQQHLTEHCDKSEALVQLTSVHYNSDTETSAVEEDVMTSPVATMQLASGQNGLGEDVVNNNEIGVKTAFLENNPDYPVAKSSNDPIDAINHSPNDSGYAHDRESNASLGEMAEGKEREHPHDTSDDNPNLVIDEDIADMPASRNHSITNEYNTPYITIKPDSEMGVANQSIDVQPFDPLHIKAGQSLLKHQIYTPEVSPVFPDLTIRKTTPTKTTQLPVTVNGVTPPARRCAPVREAVDPAKYITVQEGDGIKYACSKCGNIYKWRKSLNKHWKEKHDGEIPEPRAGGNIPIPRLGNSFMGNARIGNQQVSPRQMTQRVSQVKQDSPYLSSLATSIALNQGAFKSPTLSPYSNKSDNPFASMRPGSLKSSPSPKSRNTNMPYYRSSPSKKQYNSNDVLSYLTNQQQIVSSLLPAANNSSSLSPPMAHSSKPVPTYIPTRSNLEAPIDLTHTDMAVGRSLNMSQEQDGVLDLSMKSSKKTSSIVAQSKPSSNMPLQDEPLDFSKPLPTDKSETEGLKLQSGSWTIPKPESSFLPYKAMMSPPLMKESTQTKQCKLCSYVTRDELDLEKHMHLHTDQEINCAECKEKFNAVDDLNQHFVLRHMQVLAKRMAQVRSERANTPENKTGDQLYQYLTQNQSKRITSCIVCGAMYQFQWALARHFEQEHTSLPNPYQLSNSPSPDHMSSPITDPQVTETANDKIYKCTQCPFSASSSSELTRHSIRHSLNKHHVCKMCGYTARAKDELAEHYEMEHPNVHPADLKSSTGTVMLAPGDDSDDSQGGESTRIIGPDGKSIIDLGSEENTAIVFPQAPEETGRGSNGRPGRKPTSSVDVLLPYKCSVCEYRARWPSEITQHMKNHSDEKPFRCPRCTYKSKWKWDVVKHLKRCGGGTVKDVIDITKVMHFSNAHSHSPDNLAVTQARELSKGPPNVTVVPNMETSPFGHEHSNEMSGENSLNTSNTSTLECSECFFVGTSESDMRKHAKFHTYDAQQVYCSQCPFVGNNPAELKRHQRVHSTEKPYICKTCGYSSKWKCDLKKHCRTYNHLPAVPLTYGGHGRKPTNKDEAFSDQTQSDDQVMSHDEYDSTDAEAGEMVQPHSDGDHLRCEQCPYATPNEALYDHHMQLHENEKRTQFKCSHCDYEGNELSAFLQHKLIHVSNTHDVSHETGEITGETEGQNEATESAGNRRKQSKQSIMKKSEAPDSPLQGGIVDDETKGAVHSDTMHLVTPENYALQNRNETNAMDFRSSTKTFYCQKCNYSTNMLQNYESHIESHSSKNDIKYKCEHCSWSSDALYMLYRHAQVVHSDLWKDVDKYAFYERVKERYGNETPAVKHWVPSPAQRSPSVSPAHSPVMGADGKPMYREGKKTKRRLKSCMKCGYITDNVTTLQRHMAKHGKQGKYTCTHCDYSVDKQHVVEYHMRLVHYNQVHTESPAPSPSAMPSPMEVDNDNNSNSTVEFNEVASPSNISTGEQDAVDFENVDVSTLKGEDVKIVHIGNRTVYGCSKCPYNTMKVSSVLNHSRQHGANKKYTCTSCDYSTDHISHVRNHMKSLHGDDGSASQNTDTPSNAMPTNDINNVAYDFTEHAPSPKRARVDSNSDSPFACSHCTFVGENMTDLVGHKCNNARVLNCARERCDYTSTSDSLMKLHMKTHNLKTSHSTKVLHFCDRCPYFCVNRSQLDAHKTRHGVKSKFDCPFCDYSCGHATQQGNHLKLHFPNQEIDRDVLHALARGEHVPGLVPTLKSSNDVVIDGQGQNDFVFEEGVDESEVIDDSENN